MITHATSVQCMLTFAMMHATLQECFEERPALHLYRTVMQLPSITQLNCCDTEWLPAEWGPSARKASLARQAA